MNNGCDLLIFTMYRLVKVIYSREKGECFVV